MESIDIEESDESDYAVTATIKTFYKDDDIVLIKAKGPKSLLSKVTKKDLKVMFALPQDFRLELIPTDTLQIKMDGNNLTDCELFDKLIDNRADTDEHKAYLKDLWKGVYSASRKNVKLLISAVSKDLSLIFQT